MRSVSLVALVLFALHPLSLGQTTWYVDVSQSECPGSGSLADPFCRIQDALVASSLGDTILVAPGIYPESIDFLGKDVALRSTDGPESTILDPGGTARGVSFQSGETRAALLEGFTIRHGGAVDKGGGVYCRQSSPTIRDCRIQDCRASSRGGGLALETSEALVADCLITGNSVGLDSFLSSDGGGIWILGSAPRIEHCEIRDNVAEVRGGGVYCANTSAVLLSNTIAVNHAGLRDVFSGIGAGLHIINGSTQVEANVIIDNVSEGTEARGGGVYWRATTIDLVDNQVLRNLALSESDSGQDRRSQGGGLFLRGSGSLVGNTISGNVARCRTDGYRVYSRGGGVCFYGVELSLSGDVLSGNKAYGIGGPNPSWGRARGGGLFAQGVLQGRDLLIRDNACQSSGYFASSDGGGTFLDGMSEIRDAAILENVVSETGTFNTGSRGAGLRCLGDTSISNTTIGGNISTGIYGYFGLFGKAGGIDAERLTLTHSTVAFNRNDVETFPYPDNTFGGVWVHETAEIVDSILWGNGTSNLTIASGTVSHCDIEGGFPGTSNLDLDPRFLDPASLDLRLACDSPCIDQGILLPDSPDDDVEGDSRVVDGDGDGLAEPDIGADEFDLLWRLRIDPETRVFDFEAQAPPAQLGRSAILFLSRGDTGTIPVPDSGGQSLSLNADLLFSSWLRHPAPLRTTTLAPCPGGHTTPGLLPLAASGIRIYFAGVSFDAAARVWSVTPTRSVVLP